MTRLPQLLGAAACLAALLVVLLLESLSPLPYWAATALFLLGAQAMAPRLGRWWRVTSLRSARWVARLERALPYGLTLGVVAWAFFPLTIGVPPISQDHGDHYLATSVLVDDLLGSGHLFGWSDRIATGLPFGDVYATSAYLVTGLLRIVSFGAVSLSTSYAIGIVLVWLIAAFAIVAWARRLGCGPLTPVLAAAAFALDVGGDREGGWVYSMFHGVWPQILATGLWLWTLLALVRLAERPTWRRLGAAVLVGGAAFWAHPMSAVNLLVTAPLIVLVHLLVHREPLAASREAGRRGALWIIVALGLAACIGIGWISHMMTAADDMTEHYASWRPLQQLAGRIFEGGLFADAIPLVGILALVGLGTAWLRRSRVDVLTGGLVVALLVLGSMDLIVGFDLGVREGFPLFMYRRFSITAKPLWYALAGLGATSAWLGARALWMKSAPAGRAGTALALVVSAPLIWSLLAALPGVIEGPAARPLIAAQAGLNADFAGMRELLEEEDERLADDAPRRVIYWQGRGGGAGDYPLFPIADAGFGYVPDRTAPAQTFERFETIRSVEAARWLGATLLISQGSQRPSRLDDAIDIGRFGRFRIYRLADAGSWPVRVEGGGEAEVVAWGPMRRRIRLRGVGPKSRVLLGFPHYRKWHAEQEDRSVALSAGRYLGTHVVKISGSELRDGILEITYRDTVLERIAGGVAALVALLALVAIVVLGRRPLPLWPGEVAVTRLSGLLVAGAIVGAATLVFILSIAGDQALEADALRGAPKGARFLGAIHRRAPTSFEYAPRPYCVRPFTRRPRAGCTETVLEPRLRSGIRSGHRLPSCMAFGVPDHGRATLRFGLPPGTDLLRGRLHLLDGDVEDARFQDLAPIKPGQRGFEIPVDRGGHEVELRLTNDGGTATVCLELYGLDAPGAEER